MATQKVALITAGTAGLGAAIARVLAPDFRVACFLVPKDDYLPVTLPNVGQ
jgi:NAD(P)-dependent dehydrogenase (short-subunit alcohol dehydrogenase family)